MNPFIVFLLVVAGLGAFTWLWRAAPRDLQPGAPQGMTEGHQGRCVRWLQTAAIAPPANGAWAPGPRGPADRVLDAVLARRETDLQAARQRLMAQKPDGIAAALAQGRMGRAARLAAHRRYRGPPAMFPLWYAFIYRIRRGPRGIHLDVLSQALEEDP